jgi:iron complex outermembrane recepter protein
LNNATITVNGAKYPETKIPPWVTFDAGVSYSRPDGPHALDGVRVAFTVQNLADRDPPIVLSTVNAFLPGGTSAVDLANHNIFGRVWSVELTKKF